jgi:hypothetical protein
MRSVPLFVACDTSLSELSSCSEILLKPKFAPEDLNCKSGAARDWVLEEVVFMYRFHCMMDAVRNIAIPALLAHHAAILPLGTPTANR